MAPRTTDGAGKGASKAKGTDADGTKGKAKPRAKSGGATKSKAKGAGAAKGKSAAGGRRRARPAPRSVGLDAAAVAAEDTSPPAALAELAGAVRDAGGQPLSQYRDPLGGHWLMLAVLPIDQIDATPYQRELSDAHTRRLASVIPKVGRFLDPVVAVRAGHHGDGVAAGRKGDGAGHDGGGTGAAFWTPNGMHRLEAMRRLGAKSIVALLVPEHRLAYRILALNTEKAHNLKDKSLEVTRMEDALATHPETAARPESDWAFEFEEPAYLTIGRAYQQRARYSGGAYLPVVKRCEVFLDQPISDALELRSARAERLLALDDLVNDLVVQLKDAGLKSAYLKPFVVARLNPLRFVPAPRGAAAKAAAQPDFDETLDRMMARGEKFEAAKIKPQDLAAMGGAPSDADDS